jgi:hypothetical protein
LEAERLGGSWFEASPANNSVRPCLEKNLFTKKGWWSSEDVGPEFNPQYHKKRKQLQMLARMWGERNT